MIGGDHLGQFPRKNKTENTANKNSAKLIKECIQAGYKKIHIDTTHRLKSDYDFNLQIILKRTKNLMKLLKKKNLVFGSEVPYPGSLNKAYKSKQSINSLNKEIDFYSKNLKKLKLKSEFACVVEPGMFFLDKELLNQILNT